MEDELLMHEMWTHYNSDDDDTEDDDHGGTTAADGIQADQPIQQGNPQQQNTEIENNVSSSSQKPHLTLTKKECWLMRPTYPEINGKFAWGLKTEIAKKHGISRMTLDRIWKDAKKQREAGHAIDVRNKKSGRCGRKLKVYDDKWLQSVPLNLRTSIRAFAGYLKVPPSTVYSLLKRGKLRSHTSSTHPKLTEDHKIQRMKWVLQHILPATRTQPPKFVDMQNVVHIDEKWFYLSPDMRRFYLLPAEDDPYSCCQSKRFKIKAMFMCATSRPIKDSEGRMIHDGKFGIYPFVEYGRAKYTTKNRRAGTMLTKAIESVTLPVMRDMIVNTIILAIMRNWPEGVSKEIYIQQDNARPHIHASDPQFIAAATQNGFNIQLINRPAQSPDLNVLDLGFFRAIQALQYQSFPKNLDELILRVQDCYDFFDPEVLKYTWLQLQYVMVEILKCKGGNNFKNPHHAKRKLERLGLLPENVEVDQAVIDEAVTYLNERFVNVGQAFDYLDAHQE
ncbi:uncharacterized protein LOC125495774 [Beta vulgaris subsp. vulgaris]|uniref:uncharacterized protein LOC125495774 n=1 Tax=Beta vulgaris subsp. vulgaris TaxID=3555 RepID=UPI002548A706|nr:uncharacterized protein LOC125495774 [Beta vulgaris subsp. vulgaris]